MDAEPAADEFHELFHEIFVRFHVRDTGADRGVSREAWAVMEHLSEAGPLTVTEAARHFARSQAAMSEIVTRLERRGLLTRFTDERDRRRTLVWLSRDGVAAWRRAQRPLDRGQLVSAFTALSAHQRQQTLVALRRLLRRKLR